MSILYEMQRVSLNYSFYLLTRSFFFSTTQFSRSLLQLKQDERTEIFDIYVPTTGALFPGRHFEIPSATPIYLACVQTPPPPPPPL